MNPEPIALTAEHAPELRRLMNHAFGHGRIPDPPSGEESDPEGTIGIVEDGRLRAALTICDFQTHWGATTLPMGGIAGVATYADARGRGLVDRMLRQSLERMRANGQVVSSLFPFAFAFYRKFGWDWVGEKRTYVLPLRELPRRREITAARELDAPDPKTILAPIYTQVARHYHGAFTAESHKWHDPLNHNDGRTTYVHTTDGGYMIWRYPGSGGGPLDIREYMATTPDADAALLALLRDIGTQVEQGRVHLPADTPIWSSLMHWDVSTTVQPVFMGRVVDLAAALAARPIPPDLFGTLTLAVADEHAPWNDGVWRLTADGGVLSAARTQDTPQIAADIAAVSQAYWGTPSVATLRRAGRLTVHDDAAFGLLCQLLPPALVYCWDGF
jgi:predicted acetyltransferase